MIHPSHRNIPLELLLVDTFASVFGVILFAHHQTHHPLGVATLPASVWCAVSYVFVSFSTNVACGWEGDSVVERAEFPTWAGVVNQHTHFPLAFGSTALDRGSGSKETVRLSLFRDLNGQKSIEPFFHHLRHMLPVGAKSSKPSPMPGAVILIYLINKMWPS